MSTLALRRSPSSGLWHAASTTCALHPPQLPPQTPRHHPSICSDHSFFNRQTNSILPLPGNMTSAEALVHTPIAASNQPQTFHGQSKVEAADKESNKRRRGTVRECRGGGSCGGGRPAARWWPCTGSSPRTVRTPPPAAARPAAAAAPRPRRPRPAARTRTPPATAQRPAAACPCPPRPVKPPLQPPCSYEV